MIKSIKLLLGTNLVDCEIDDETIHACLKLAKDRHKRGKQSFIDPDNIDSWIFDYALANCKLIMGEARSKFETDGQYKMNGEILIALALERIASLENEIKL